MIKRRKDSVLTPIEQKFLEMYKKEFGEMSSELALTSSIQSEEASKLHAENMDLCAEICGRSARLLKYALLLEKEKG